MKKLIATGVVLSTLLGTTPQISILTTANTKIHNENNFKKWTPIPEYFEYIEKYFNSKTEQEKQELKENLLSAISLKKDVVTFDKSKLNQKIWDLKIYQIIISDEYLKILNLYYKDKLLTFDEQGKAHFNFSTLEKVKINGIWYETHWYWFSIAELHFSSEVIENITDGGLSVTEIAVMIIEAFPPAAPAAIVIATFITINIVGLRAYDYGRGAWMQLYLFTIPTFVFGSN